MLDAAELEWVALDQEVLRFARLIDGIRTIRELAAISGCDLLTAQTTVGALRDRHVVSV